MRIIAVSGAVAAIVVTSAGASATLREGAVSTETDDTAAEAGQPKDTTGAQAPKASPISIGTLYGVVIPMFVPGYYAVQDRRVVRTRDADTSDYFQPGVFVLPSVALGSWGVIYKKNQVVGGKVETSLVTRGYTLSAIIPAGLTVSNNDGKALAIGAGLALGWTAGAGAEVGFAVAVVWQSAPFLSKAQQASLDGGTQLGAADSDRIDTRLRPSLSVGIYLSPTF